MQLFIHFSFQVCISKTDKMLVNTFEAINQKYHFLSTDRDIIEFKFLHGATHASRVQPLLVCSDKQGCRWWAMGSHKWPVHWSPDTVVHMVSDVSWWCMGADRWVALSRSVCTCYSVRASPLRPVIRARQLFTPPRTTPAACVGTPARTPQHPVSAWKLQPSLRASGTWLRLKLPFRLLWLLPRDQQSRLKIRAEQIIFSDSCTIILDQGTQRKIWWGYAEASQGTSSVRTQSL